MRDLVDLNGALLARVLSFLGESESQRLRAVCKGFEDRLSLDEPFASLHSLSVSSAQLALFAALLADSRAGAFARKKQRILQRKVRVCRGSLTVSTQVLCRRYLRAVKGAYRIAPTEESDSLLAFELSSAAHRSDLSRPFSQQVLDFHVRTHSGSTSAIPPRSSTLTSRTLVRQPFSLASRASGLRPSQHANPQLSPPRPSVSPTSARMANPGTLEFLRTFGVQWEHLRSLYIAADIFQAASSGGLTALVWRDFSDAGAAQSLQITLDQPPFADSVLTDAFTLSPESPITVPAAVPLNSHSPLGAQDSDIEVQMGRETETELRSSVFGGLRFYPDVTPTLQPSHTPSQPSMIRRALHLLQVRHDETSNDETYNGRLLKQILEFFQMRAQILPDRPPTPHPEHLPAEAFTRHTEFRRFASSPMPVADSPVRGGGHRPSRSPPRPMPVSRVELWQRCFAAAVLQAFRLVVRRFHEAVLSSIPNLETLVVQGSIFKTKVFRHLLNQAATSTNLALDRRKPLQASPCRTSPNGGKLKALSDEIVTDMDKRDFCERFRSCPRLKDCFFPSLKSLCASETFVDGNIFAPQLQRVRIYGVSSFRSIHRFLDRNGKHLQHASIAFEDTFGYSPSTTSTSGRSSSSIGSMSYASGREPNDKGPPFWSRNHDWSPMCLRTETRSQTRSQGSRSQDNSKSPKSETEEVPETQFTALQSLSFIIINEPLARKSDFRDPSGDHGYSHNPPGYDFMLGTPTYSSPGEIGRHADSAAISLDGSCDANFHDRDCERRVWRRRRLRQQHLCQCGIPYVLWNAPRLKCLRISTGCAPGRGHLTRGTVFALFPAFSGPLDHIQLPGISGLKERDFDLPRCSLSCSLTDHLPQSLARSFTQSFSVSSRDGSLQGCQGEVNAGLNEGVNDEDKKQKKKNQLINHMKSQMLAVEDALLAKLQRQLGDLRALVAPLNTVLLILKAMRRLPRLEVIQATMIMQDLFKRFSRVLSLDYPGVTGLLLSCDSWPSREFEPGLFSQEDYDSLSAVDEYFGAPLRHRQRSSARDAERAIFEHVRVTLFPGSVQSVWLNLRIHVCRYPISLDLLLTPMISFHCPKITQIWFLDAIAPTTSIVQVKAALTASNAHFNRLVFFTQACNADNHKLWIQRLSRECHFERDSSYEKYFADFLLIAPHKSPPLPLAPGSTDALEGPTSLPTVADTHSATVRAKARLETRAAILRAQQTSPDGDATPETISAKATRPASPKTGAGESSHLQPKETLFDEGFSTLDLKSESPSKSQSLNSRAAAAPWNDQACGLCAFSAFCEDKAPGLRARRHSERLRREYPNPRPPPCECAPATGRNIDPTPGILGSGRSEVAGVQGGGTALQLFCKEGVIEHDVRLALKLVFLVQQEPSRLQHCEITCLRRVPPPNGKAQEEESEENGGAGGNGGTGGSGDDRSDNSASLSGSTSLSLARSASIGSQERLHTLLSSQLP